MYVSDEYSELRQELKNGLVIDPPMFCKKFQNLAPMIEIDFVILNSKKYNLFIFLISKKS